MLDINLIRKEPKKVEEALQKRDFKFDSTKFLEIDEKRRALIGEIEVLKAERNKKSALVPQMKKEGKSIDEIVRETKELGEKISSIEKNLDKVTEEFNDVLFGLPNMPDDDVEAGGKENNKPIKTFGEKRNFDFEFKSHIDLCNDLDLIDYERASKLSGNGFWLYKGLGAQLEWALLNFFVSEHLKDGYEFILPPEMLNEKCGFGSGQFPKFADEVYYVDKAGSDDKQFLIPTAETALVNLYANEIIPKDKLPYKMFAYTPCFRREAGSYRSEERGIIRGHQFNKVEMIVYCTEEDSDKMFDELVKKATGLVEKLGLHYQLSKLAAGDCSASMARTFDIEVYIPSMGIYKEVSSVSNGRSYQARRSNTRYKTEEGNKFVHILNGSGLATARLLAAIVEQYQNKDGSVTIPEVLRPFMGGREKIEKN